MSDQADKLREIIRKLNRNKNNSLNLSHIKENQQKCRVITVTSGKGGVGKTNISANLAINLTQMGYRVVLLDADFGLANVDILFGISPRYTLLDVIHNNKTIFDILSDGPLNVKFISGGSGIEEMANLEKSQLQRVIDEIASLDKLADIVIVDTGAGVSDNVINFIHAADDVILITTPEPTSIMDAYALIKMVANKQKKLNMQMIVNRAESEKEALSIANKLCTASERFLGFKLQLLGYVLNDAVVIKAVKQQDPFILSYPNSPVAKQVNDISHRLISGTEYKGLATVGIRGFFNKLTNLINV